MKSERYERVLAAIHRKVPDKVPWTLWGHFPATHFLKYYSWEKATRDGEELAKAHIALLNELDHKSTMRSGTPQQVEDQVKASIEEAAGGGGFIIGAGCTLYQDTPLENFNAVAKDVEKHVIYQR